MVDKLRTGIVSRYFLNRECNCSSTTKVKVTCDYKGDYRARCVFYKVTCKKCLSVYVRNTQNTLKKIMEHNFLDMAQKVQQDKSSDTFAAHFAQHFDRKPTPQQCCERIKFEILSKVKPIVMVKTWSKSSCLL